MLSKEVMEIDNQWHLIFTQAKLGEAKKIKEYLRHCCLLCGRHYGNLKFPEQELWKSSASIEDGQTLYLTNSCTDLSMLKLGKEQVEILLKKLRQKIQKAKTLEDVVKVLEKHRKKVAKLKEKHGISHGIYISKEKPKKSSRNLLKSLRKSTGALPSLNIVEIAMNDSLADDEVRSISTGALEDSSFVSLPSVDSSVSFSESFIKKKLESPRGRPKLTRAKSAQD